MKNIDTTINAHINKDTKNNGPKINAQQNRQDNEGKHKRTTTNTRQYTHNNKGTTINARTINARTITAREITARKITARETMARKIKAPQ